jgi:hypothetical protein
MFLEFFFFATVLLWVSTRIYLFWFFSDLLFMKSCHQYTEITPTEYEKQRAANVMRNNQMFQRLGINQLRTLMTGTIVRSKNDVPEESGSLFDREKSNDSEKEEVRKFVIRLFVSSCYI